MNPKNMPGPGDLGGPSDYDEFEDYCPKCGNLYENCVCICAGCDEQMRNCTCGEEDLNPSSINIRGER